MSKSIVKLIDSISYWEMVVIVLMLFTILEGAVAVDKTCSVSRCSDEGPRIHNPFWLKQDNTADDDDDDDCAYPPGFQVSCSGGNTVIEFQHLVETSIKGLLLSFIYKANVTSIDYAYRDIYLDDIPYLTDIVPTPLLSNSSSTTTHIPFSPPYTYPDQPPYTHRPHIYCYDYSLYDPLSECSYNHIYPACRYKLVSFFNCSSPSAVTDMSSYDKIDPLSTRDFQVYAYSSQNNTFQMLSNIRSCTKMYSTISTEMPYFLQPCNFGVGRVLSWYSTPVGGVKCEAVREKCNFADESVVTTSYTKYSEPPPGDHLATIKRVLAVILPCTFLVVLGLTFLYNFMRLADKQKKEDELKIKTFMEDYKARKPTRYSYSDIKKMTHMLKHKLGQGGYGSVFKGQISSDLLVAVKVLHSDPKANGDDFINEVGTIGKIHHVNVVRLLGYCADGSNRALVYEFQPNHSLEKFVYKREKQHNFIGWKKMQKIALGIAKGIEYLHKGCTQQILHFDIKPNNILLDQNFNPKISDFGLAKLCNKGQSIVSMTSMTAARGTIGYIAPEVFSRNFGNVSSKSDVYSFGMLLLEMVGGKNNDVAGEQNNSEVYFPEWIFHRLEKGGELVIQIENEDDSKIARKLTIVGLWCIGWHPIDRPSMKLVIQMLEGDKCPAMPPNPFTSATSGNATHAKSLFSEKLRVISEAE